MAKGGILLVAEIGILYLTIYRSTWTHELISSAGSIHFRIRRTAATDAESLDSITH